jgi:hypothetical protein
LRVPNITYAACTVAFSFVLAVPGPAYAYAHSAHVYRHVHHATQAKNSPKNVTALLAISPAKIIKETDGLSRNSDDCNDGCIDH